MMGWSGGRGIGAFTLVACVIVACAGDDGETTSITPAASDGSAAAISDPASTQLGSTATAASPTAGVCAPAPRAACSFAETFSPPIGPAADLTGIDLRNANIGENIDLSDAVLVGAHFDGATVVGRLSGADLTGASLVDTDLSGTDLSDAILAGANLTGADVNATLFDAIDLETAAITNVSVGVRGGETLAGVDFNGFDLTGVSFSSHASGPISMAAARFTGAILTGASFDRVDLTAADFTDAVFAVEGGAEPTFTDTRCPDFLPSDDTLKGRAGCRL